MSYVIKLISLACGIPTQHDGEYLVNADPDAFDGRGHVLSTRRIADARRFQSPREALNLWQQQSIVHPLRDDLKPNRPLTAFTIELLPVAAPQCREGGGGRDG